MLCADIYSRGGISGFVMKSWSTAGIYDRDIFEKDSVLKMNARSQNDLCEFCDSWLENIADQQEL